MAQGLYYMTSKKPVPSGHSNAFIRQADHLYL
jgi:hypothetical protein